MLLLREEVLMDELERKIRWYDEERKGARRQAHSLEHSEEQRERGRDRAVLLTNVIDRLKRKGSA